MSRPPLRRQDRAALAELFGACPDCNADSSLRTIGSGVYTLVVQHDPTCPRLAQISGASRDPL